MENIYKLNRYSGNDKLDNSKRITYSINGYSQNFKSSLSQSYEFTNNSNFHKEQGNDNNLSDLLGSIAYLNENELSYNFRYDLNDEYLKKQNVNLKSKTKLGEVQFSYLDQNTKVNNIITNDTETINAGNVEPIKLENKYK